MLPVLSRFMILLGVMLKAIRLIVANVLKASSSVRVRSRGLSTILFSGEAM